MLNHPGQDYTILQKIAKKITWPTTNEMYGASYLPANVLVDKHPKHFVDVLETNLAISYQTVVNNNVIVGTYKLMKDRFSYTNLMAMQTRPDTVFGRNQIITVTDLFKYHYIMIVYREQMLLKNLFSEEIGVVLEELLNMPQIFSCIKVFGLKIYIYFLQDGVHLYI